MTQKERREKKPKRASSLDLAARRYMISLGAVDEDARADHYIGGCDALKAFRRRMKRRWTWTFDEIETILKEMRK